MPIASAKKDTIFYLYIYIKDIISTEDYIRYRDTSVSQFL